MVHHRMQCLSHGGGAGRNTLVIAFVRESRIIGTMLKKEKKGGFEGRARSMEGKIKRANRVQLVCQAGSKGDLSR
jgi:hypothetical protein